MEDKSLYDSQQPQGISENLQRFIDSMVEEIVLEGKPFDTQKKYLRKFSEKEGLHYETIESKLSDFIEIMKEWLNLHTKSSELMAKMLAKECYLSEKELKKLFFASNMRKNEFGGHKYVDLGLPSGSLWATCNVGAAKPDDYGDYYAWGETQPKNSETIKYYKFYDGGIELTKYNISDSLVVLQEKDDAAVLNWGEGWHIPDKEEWEELFHNTNSFWTIRNGIKGMLFTAPNGNDLFLPAAGCFDETDEIIESVGVSGNYWSRSLLLGSSESAWSVILFNDEAHLANTLRFEGLSIRAVRSR